MAKTLNATNEQRRAWWREPMMWLIVGGPAVVVVASFITLTLAIKHPDPVLVVEQGPAAGGEVADFRTGTSNAHIPALQARNHAATGGR
jgi:hypothetical protein